MDMRYLVGRNVRRMRLAKGLTQEALAERSGFSQQYLSDLEHGRRNPTVVTLFELAQALGASYLNLLLDDAGVAGAAEPLHGGFAEDAVELVDADALDADQRAQAGRLIPDKSPEGLEFPPSDTPRRAFARLEMDRVVGWIVARQSHPRAWRIEALGGDSARSDLAVALIAGLERQARAAGMLTVHVEVAEAALYQGLGYQVTGRLEDAGGPGRPAIQLSKSLSG